MKSIINALLLTAMMTSCSLDNDQEYEIYVPENLEERNGYRFTIQQIKEETNKSYADYLQLVIIYAALDEPKEVIDHFFQLAVERDEMAVCQMIYGARECGIDFFSKYEDEIDAFYDVTFPKYEVEIITLHNQSKAKCEERTLLRAQKRQARIKGNRKND